MYGKSKKLYKSLAKIFPSEFDKLKLNKELSIAVSSEMALCSKPYIETNPTNWVNLLTNPKSLLKIFNNEHDVYFTIKMLKKNYWYNMVLDNDKMRVTLLNKEMPILIDDDILTSLDYYQTKIKPDDFLQDIKQNL